MQVLGRIGYVNSSKRLDFGGTSYSWCGLLTEWIALCEGKLLITQ